MVCGGRQTPLYTRRNKMGYVICSAFYAEDTDTFKYNLFNEWYSNTLRFSNPDKLFIVNHGCKRPEMITDNKVCWIDLNYNLGHMGDLLSGKKNHKFSGWAMSVLNGALLAYSNNCDMFYKEQDCLAFGNWIERIYETSNGKSFVFGKCKTTPHNVEQSLFFIRNNFLCEFVKDFLSIEGGDDKTLTEEKFLIIEKKHMEATVRLDFGYGRDRPFDMNKDVFYIQQEKSLEIKQLKDKGLL
jgi:hypothetical protein